MKKTSILLVLTSILLLVACNQSVQNQEPNNTEIMNGRWELIDPAYEPEAIDLSKTLPIPDSYNGKTLKELWDYAYQYYDNGHYPEGFDITWAGSPIIAPDGKTAAYVSNKNCIKVNGLSVFSLDIKTGKETLLLGSSDSHEYYNALWWVDHDTLICERSDSSKSYISCNLDGTSKRIHLKGSDPYITAWNRKHFLYTPEPNSNTRNIASIEDGKVSEEGVIQCTEGSIAVESAISPDGSKAALKIYNDDNSGTRTIAIYDRKTKKLYKISNPDIEGADVIAAINMNWSNKYVEVNFYTSKDQMEHNELWKYIIL